MFFDRNIASLEKFHRDTYTELEHQPTRAGEAGGRFSVERAKKGAPTLLLTGTDGKRKYFHSAYDPVGEAEKTAKLLSERIKRESSIIFLGMGLGYLPIAAVSEIRQDQELVIIEPSPEVFNLALRHVDLTPVLNRPNTHIFVGHAATGWLGGMPHEQSLETAHHLHPPYAPIFPELAVFAERLDMLSGAGIKRALDYPKFATDPPRALVFEGGFFLEKELATAFEMSNVDYKTIPVKVSGKADSGFVKELLTDLTSFKPDFVLSVNQIGFDIEGKLARLLSRYKIPFVCWFVDNPSPLLQCSGANAVEYGIYLTWDRSYVAPMKALGFDKTEYLPYATDSTIFHPPDTPAEKKYPVSFVGSSMTGIIKTRLGELEKNPELLRVYARLKDIPEGPAGTITATEAIGAVGASYAARASLEAALVSEWTRRKRVERLLALERFSPHVFGDDGWEKLLTPSFTIHPPVDYRTELPDIYRASAINLNVSNVQSLDSPNQRLFDISACGSLLITDGTGCVAQFLEPGVSVETYRTKDELRDKTGYYLDNPQKRVEIEKSASEAILARHTYSHRIHELFNILRKQFP